MSNALTKIRSTNVTIGDPPEMDGLMSSEEAELL